MHITHWNFSNSTSLMPVLRGGPASLFPFSVESAKTQAIQIEDSSNHLLFPMAKNTKYAGKWLNFCEISFTNSHGESREWEYAARTGFEGAAGVVAIEDGATPKIILVKQFRHPLQNYSLEFPAGLVDPGESFQSAALRELEEETGLTGEVVQVGPPVYSSPGVTNEFVSLVTIKITGQTQTKLGADENVEVVKLPLADLVGELIRVHSTGVVIDAKLWSFAQGLSWNPPKE